MDPAPSFLPKIDPNDSGNHAESGPRVSLQVSLQNPHQQLSPERSPSKEKPDVHKMGPAEMPRSEVKSYQKKDQQAVQHLPAPVDPTQAQAQASSIGLNFLPAACPPPLHLQALSPGAVPELLCPPCSSLPSYWLPPAYPHWLSSNFGFSPYLLRPFSSPPEFWCNPWLFPPILCPQMMPVHQTCAADEASGSTQVHVTPASERGEKHAGTEGQRAINHVKEAQQNKLQEGNAGADDNPGSKIKISDSPGLSPLWYEELMEEDGFEECMKLLDSFFAQATKTGEECGDAGTQKVENDSFLEYLDELCSDKDFVRKVGSMLKIETFMPSLSSAQDLLDVFAQEQREQEMQEELPPLPANSNPLSEETAPLSYKQASQVLPLDPPGIQSAASPKQKEQNSPKTEDWICGSPLRPSHLLEEPPSADDETQGPVKDPFPPPEESQTPLDAFSAPSNDGIFMPMMRLFPDTSKVSDLESDDRVDTILSLGLMELKIQTMPPPVESPSTSRQGPDVSADLLTESLQKSTCQPPHPQPPAPIGKPEGHLSSRFDAAHDLSSDPDSFNFPVRRTLPELESENQIVKPAKPRRGMQGEREGKHAEMRKPQKQRVMKEEKKEEQLCKNKIKVKPSILIRCNQRLLDDSKQEKDGERKISEENGKKTAKPTPKRKEGVQQKTGEKELFKRKEGDKRSQKTKITSTAEQHLEMAKKEKLRNPKLEAGKWGEPSNPTFCSETAVNKNLFSTPTRVQPTSTTRRKTKRSQGDREQTGKSSPEWEMEGMKLQATEFVLQNVPVISPVKRIRIMRGGEAGAANIRETVSACPTKETKAPLDEGCKPERPSSCWKSTCANTSVTTSGSPPTWFQKSKNLFDGTIWNMRPEVQTSIASRSKPSPGAGAQDDEELCGEPPSPVKRPREKWEAIGTWGQSTDNARMENKQLRPKKARRGKTKGQKHPKAAKSKS